MYSKILVPLDGSELAEQALPQVIMIAKRFNSEAILLTTFVPGDRLEHPLKSYMEEKAEELKSAGIKASSIFVQGDAATEIINFAEKNDVDLIVLTTHGCTGDRCWPLGSISNKVLQRSHTPTLLIRPGQPETATAEKDLQRVLISLDGSPVAEGIIPYVESLIKGTDSEVVLLMIIEPITLPHMATYRDHEEYQEKLMSHAEKEAKNYLSKMEGALRDKGIKVSSALLRGKPNQAILKYAEDNSISLIALTTHGYSGISKWVYGSVASHVIEGSSKPVLLVRPPLPAD